MGYLSDTLAFDKFWQKDLWKNLKADPKRLILGVDPASTWAWNKVLGRDDKPLVDQMGGPYDGRVFSYGHGNGEVYDRAQAAGINTAAGSQNHDTAHIVALAAMGGGALGGGGGGGAGGAQPGLWEQGFAGKTSFATGLPSSSTSVASGIPGIAGPVGGGTGASSAASMGAMDYAKLGMGLAGSAQPQQQNQAQPQQAPVRTMAQPTQTPTYGQRIGQGLGRVSSAMFPVDPSTGLTADQTRQLQTNALMQMGLGMLGSSSQGAGFGEAAAKGYGLAQGNLQGRLQQNYENSMANRAETRAVDREKRYDEQNQWMREHQQQRDLITDSRQLADFDYRAQQDQLAREQAEADRKATADYRNQQLGIDKARLDAMAGIPAGYERDPNKPGALRYIPGGPADPSVSNARNAGVPTEDERKSAGYAVRMERALKTMSEITTKNPGASTPDIAPTLAGGIPLVGGMAENALNTKDRQRIEAAQRDALDAALTLATGAAYTKQQFDDLKKAYFPQVGDDKKTIEEKEQRFATIIEVARVRAGRAASTIPQITGGGLGQPSNPSANGLQFFPNSQGAADAAIAQRSQRYY
jgi:hypothetical protein